jgi:hypothetical protein
MADRYWVGGAGTWDATTTTNWSATSGGLGGASAPTSIDNAIFNTLSNATAYAVTVGTNANALDITIAGPAVGNVTITSGATAVINCYGSWTNAATGVVFTTTTGATINFLATTTGKTITTNAVTLGGMQVIFNGVGGAWTLGSALTTTQGIVVTAGSFSTSGSNYALATTQISSSNSNVRSILLNASVVTISGATFVNFTITTNLTFDAGTSTITASSASNTLNSGGLTFYNVSFTGVTALTHTINGANTFNNLTFTSRTTDGVGSINISANQTISGTLTLGAANTAVRRLFVRSDTIGTQRTLTVATIATLADVDFQDIVAAGASGTWSGTRLGNCTNNSNITFGAGQTVYWNLAGAQNWSAVAWATSSGGAPAVNNFPLAQDTAIFDNTGSVTGTITIQIGWALPAINITKTGAMTLASGTQTPRIFGNLTLQAATVTTGSGILTYAAYGVTSTITSNTATFAPPLTVNSTAGGITFADGFTQPNTVTTVLTNGTLDLNGFTLTTGLFISNNNNTRAIAFGTGKIVLTATSGVIFNIAGSNITATGTNPLIQATAGGAGTRTISMSANGEANAISVDVTSGSDIISIGTTNGAYKNVDFTGFTGTVSLGNSILVFGNWNYGGTTIQGAGAGTVNFAATSGTKTITSNGFSFPGNVTFSGVGGTFQLQDDLTSGATRTCTLTTGTLDFNGFTLTTGIFSGTGSGVRKFANNTASIIVTGNATTVVGFGTTGNFTADFTPVFELNYSGSVGTRTVSWGSLNLLYVPNINVTAGSDIVTTGGTTTVNNFNFTGFTGTLGNATRNIYGNLTLVSGMATPSSGSLVTSFIGVSSQTITTAGQTLDFPVTFNGVGGTFACQDALTLGSTQPLTLTNGTLQLKSGTTNTVGSFATSGTNQKFLSATTPGSQATLSDASGTNSVSYLTIQDSNATGGAVFQAFTSDFNVDSGNNTGWKFNNAGGAFLMFF